MIEIERKFLVRSERFKNYSDKEERIVQGFLNTNPGRTVRIRIKGNKGYITVKGKSNETGLSRFEWEKEISVAEADSLLKIAEPGIIENLRYEVKSEKHTFEIDVFAGDNTGLIIAEVELQSEDEVFNKPDWLGAEVTGIAKYYNSQLSKNPFKLWSAQKI